MGKATYTAGREEEESRKLNVARGNQPRLSAVISESRESFVIRPLIRRPKGSN